MGRYSSAYSAAWYQKRKALNPSAHRRARDSAAFSRERNVARRAAVLARFYRPGCDGCGETDPVVMMAHHYIPGRKTKDPAKIERAGRLLQELRLCVPLCHNCHARVHAGTLCLRAKPRELAGMQMELM
jgi:predicted HNH restriction endonuclease